MKKIVFLFLFLAACSGVVDESPEEKTLLEEQIAKLELAVVDKESLVAQKDALVADAKSLVAGLEAELTVKQTLIDQQKVVMKDIDNDRALAEAEAEGCDERIEELETSNEKLQKMLDICQEDLT